MVYHFGPDHFSDTEALSWLWFGDYGPHIFFMISGLVIGLLAGRQQGFIPFIKRRYYRLMPTYWAALTLTTTSLLLFSASDNTPGIVAYLANITLLHKIIGIEHVDLVYWTLLVEITFYLLFACILLPVRRIDHQIGILGLWLILSYISLALKVAKPEVAVDLSALQQVLILDHAPFFIIGLVMAYARKGNFNNALLLLVLLSYIHIWLMYPSSRAAYLSGSFVIFSALVFYPSPFLSSKYLQLMGWISYPLYLIHREIGLLIIRHFEVLDYPGVGFSLALLASLLFAYWLSVYFDRSGKPLYSPVV